MCFGKKKEQVTVTKMRHLDVAQPCPQGTIGPVPVVTDPRSFSGLAAEGSRHLLGREGEVTELLSGSACNWRRIGQQTNFCGDQGAGRTKAYR